MNLSLRKRFLELRLGHANYTIYVLTFSNFLIISYTLLLERSDFAKLVFPTISVYALFFLIGYPLLAIALGYWHRTKQYPVEMAHSLILNNPLHRDLWLVVLKAQLSHIEGHAPETNIKIKELIQVLENEH